MEGWKKGQQPSASKILLLANYFQVGTDYLLGRENDYGLININETALTKEQRRLLSLFNKLGQRGQLKGIAYMEGLLEAQNLKENI
jgi:transcriptional regulator with XRE-family HTH domain